MRKAKDSSHFLVVGLNMNPDKKTVMSAMERLEVLRACVYVDDIFTYDSEEELLKEIQQRKPDVRFIGDDYEGKGFTGKFASKVEYVKRLPISTTEIKERCQIVKS